MSRRPRTPVKTQGTPDFRQRAPLPLVQLVADPVHTAPTTVYRLGECSVVITRDPPRLLWHISIAHPARYPTWDEIAEARYRLCPSGITMALLLPPLDEYVNVHSNCFQLYEIDPARLP